MPDIAAISALPINQSLLATASPGAIDLRQAGIGYIAFLQSLVAGNNVGTATIAANKAVANFYSSMRQSLAQVVFTVLGNQNVCPKCQPAH